MKKLFPLLFIILFFCVSNNANAKIVLHSKKEIKMDTRKSWVDYLIKISDPVISNLANKTLRKELSYESRTDSRKQYGYLEAFGRTIVGMAPWLELGVDTTEEGKLRAHYIGLTRLAIRNAVDPKSPDFMLFDKPSQPLVDAAFLAEGLLRAKKELWLGLDIETQKMVISALKSTRVIKPANNNWLLFSSMIEAALLEFTGECDVNILNYGLDKFENDWYVGDGQYADGVRFHLDYYNSFVIHPMLYDILAVKEKHHLNKGNFFAIEGERLSRYAAELERFISPEGTYPIVGRSIIYRSGVFHALAQASLLHLLPKDVNPAQVRCGMTKVLSRLYSSDVNFDSKGWLKIGIIGSQIDLSETYICTGSLYLCTSAFLPLGLPINDPFWSNPDAYWTSYKVWNGMKSPIDHALKN